MASKELSSILDCFGDQKAIKTLKLNTIWLKLIARVLNMPIELKGNNYYSKVFKRVNYKLWNSTFWVVITHVIHSPKLCIASKALGSQPRFLMSTTTLSLSSWFGVIHVSHSYELFIEFRVIGLGSRTINVILNPELLIESRGVSSWDPESLIPSTMLSCS